MRKQKNQPQDTLISNRISYLPYIKSSPTLYRRHFHQLLPTLYRSLMPDISNIHRVLIKSSFLPDEARL